MTLNDFFSAIAGISGLLFVVTSMLAMSLSLSVQQMTQPLKNVRLVILALLANFVLVPLLAFAIIKVIPLEQSLQIGVILAGDSRRSALHSQAGARRQGECRLRRRVDVPDHGVSPSSTCPSSCHCFCLALRSIHGTSPSR